MNFYNFVYLSLAIAIVFYFMGAGPLVQLYNQQGGGFLVLSCPEDTATYGNISGDYVNEPSQCEDTFFTQLVTILVVGGLGIVLALVLGYSAMYIIPLLILWVCINLFVFPFSFLMDPAMSDEIRIIVTVVINAMTGLALLNFIRGPT